MIIMAVDNSQPIAMQLAESLQKAFPQAIVSIFTDPHKAIIYGFEHSVDAVFSYVVIGDMNVLKLSESIRIKNENLKLYIVAEQEILDEAISWPEITGFLARPVSVDKLRQIAM